MNIISRIFQVIGMVASIVCVIASIVSFGSIAYANYMCNPVDLKQPQYFGFPGLPGPCYPDCPEPKPCPKFQKCA